MDSLSMGCATAGPCLVIDQYYLFYVKISIFWSRPHYNRNKGLASFIRERKAVVFKFLQFKSVFEKLHFRDKY